MELYIGPLWKSLLQENCLWPKGWVGGGPSLRTKPVPRLELLDPADAEVPVVCRVESATRQQTQHEPLKNLVSLVGFHTKIPEGPGSACWKAAVSTFGALNTNMSSWTSTRLLQLSRDWNSYHRGSNLCPPDTQSFSVLPVGSAMATHPFRERKVPDPNLNLTADWAHKPFWCRLRGPGGEKIMKINHENISEIFFNVKNIRCHKVGHKFQYILFFPMIWLSSLRSESPL